MKTTQQQIAVLRYISQHQKHIIQSPTHEEIAFGLQYKRRSDIYGLIAKLIRDGYLEKKGKYRNLIVTKKGKELLK